MSAENEAIDTKISIPLLLLSEDQEGERTKLLMASIREGLKARYGTEVGEEIADKPFRMLTFSEVARKKFGINAVVIVGEEAARLRVQSQGGPLVDNVCFSFKDSLCPDRILSLDISGNTTINVFGNHVFSICLTREVKRVYHSYSHLTGVMYNRGRSITDRSMVAAIIPTHDLVKELFHRSFTDRKIKMPAEFLWIDNQSPQVPEPHPTSTTPVA